MKSWPHAVIKIWYFGKVWTIWRSHFPELRHEKLGSDKHKNHNQKEYNSNIIAVFFLQKQVRNKINIVEIKQYYSRNPLNIKIGVDFERTFVKLNQGGADKKTPNDTVDQYLV
jgi:hypothetical protein